MTGQIEYQIFRNYPYILCRTLWQNQVSDPAKEMVGLKKNPGLELLREYYFSVDNLVYAEQVHGEQVELVIKSGVVGQCDGLATTRKKIPLLIRTADCASVMIFNPEQKSIANLHVGWRGALAGIIAVGIEKLSHQLKDSQKKMKVAVSPMIRGCCYEVGEEFYHSFEDKYLERRQGKFFFQLEKVIDDQLRDAGIKSGNIEFSKQCTNCSTTGLPSYRRNKTKNRLMNVIEMKES